MNADYSHQRLNENNASYKGRCSSLNTCRLVPGPICSIEMVSYCSRFKEVMFMRSLLLTIYLVSFSGLSAAGKALEIDCYNCEGKLTKTVKPDIAVAMSLEKDLAKPTGISRGLSSKKPLELKVKGYIDGCKTKRCYEMEMCNKFYLAKDRWDVEEMFEMIPTMPEHNKVDDYFFMIECSPENYNQTIGIKAPMIHLIVDNVIRRHGYLEAIYEMYDLNGEGAKLTQILNLKSTEDETFLDYLYYARKKWRTAIGEDTKKAYEKIFKYACEKGGEFSKYKGSVSCSKSLQSQAEKKYDTR